MALSITISAGLYDLPERHLLIISGIIRLVSPPFLFLEKFAHFISEQANYLYMVNEYDPLHNCKIRNNHLNLINYSNNIHNYERALSQFIVRIF
jgi:hypothetical protein